MQSIKNPLDWAPVVVEPFCTRLGLVVSTFFLRSFFVLGKKTNTYDLYAKFHDDVTVWEGSRGGEEALSVFQFDITQGMGLARRRMGGWIPSRTPCMIHMVTCNAYIRSGEGLRGGRQAPRSRALPSSLTGRLRGSA
jgi:hypothetical protein